MSIIIPTKKSVRKAGEILAHKCDASQSEMLDAMKVLSHWRTAHAYPISTFNNYFRKKVKKLDYSSSVVAQRLKRAPSIIGKLKRFPKMQLDRMQDIGGLRIILPKVEDVYRLYDEIIKSKTFKHQLELPPKDYIKEPKTDGYKSLHQVIRYQNENHPELHGLRVEIQLRTKLQHSWATAVETLGVIEKSSFKTGEGEEDFKQFFRLASAIFSIYEKQPILKDFSDRDPKDMVEELERLEKKHSIIKKLSSLILGAGQIDAAMRTGSSDYQVLELNSKERRLSVTAFTKNQLDKAESYYRAREIETREEPFSDVVLISVGALKEVKTAYPNYFLDTSEFVKNLSKACEKIRATRPS